MKGRASFLFEEGVPGREIEPPGLEFREAVDWGVCEEVLGCDRYEIRGFDEKLLPDLVGVAAELAEVRRGDGLEFAIARCVDMDNLDPVDFGDAHFDNPRC